MNTSDFYDEAINSDSISRVLESFDELDLRSHYDFESTLESTITTSEEAIELIENTKKLAFRFGGGNTLYYTSEDQVEEMVFDVDISKSFSKSDLWLSDKIIQVSDVFPNACSAELSSEQTGFYTCLVIASVFGDEFKDAFRETAIGYDFKKWISNKGESSFALLSTEWIQLGSKYIKMVAASAKFVLVRERRKKQVPSALRLPEEQVLELNRILREVDAIRFKYDDVKLSPVNRENMKKLEVKRLIAERDEAIESKLTENPRIYQIYRLSTLNSNVIPPNFILKFNRVARKECIALWKEIRGTEKDPSTSEERIAVKQVENKLKRELKRAYLNRMFAEETEKYLQSPDTYIAPDFV